MTKNKKLIVILLAIVVLLTIIWLSLDSHIKNSLYRATLCKLIYGKNICNFYEMMDVVSTDPGRSDFEKAMQLCQDMEDVPKKDSCFEYIAQLVSFYDKEKAKLACEGIKGYGTLSKEKCLFVNIEKQKDESLAEGIVIAFMDSRIRRNQELALSWLTDNGEGEYLLRSDRPLTGLSNPHFADFEILEREKLGDAQFKFKVRIYEEYTGQGRVGCFDETLTVIKDKEKYLIDSFERGEYMAVDYEEGYDQK